MAVVTALTIAAACGESRPVEVPTPETLAREVCEIAKPAFDAVSQEHARVGGTAVHEPLTAIEGLEGVFQGVSMNTQYLGGTPADVLGKEIDGEPTATFTFDDLDLTCWLYDDPASWQGVPFEGGWIILRILATDDTATSADGEPRHAVTFAIVQASKIGDVVWTKPGG